MPPRIKFEKSEIIKASINIIREQGIEALSARNIASKMNSSVKPIFTYFNNMSEVKAEVINKALEIHKDYLTRAISNGKYPPYKMVGIAYINFAKDEPNLFKLLFMRNRNDEIKPNTDKYKENYKDVINIIMKQTGLSFDKAYDLHLEIWIFVHGIASMIVTNYLNWDIDFIDNALTDVYKGLTGGKINASNKDD